MNNRISKGSIRNGRVFLFVKITSAIMQCKHLFQKGETYYEDDE